MVALDPKQTSGPDADEQLASQVVGCELVDGTRLVEGSRLVEGFNDGTKLVEGFNDDDGTKLTLGELDGNPTQVLHWRRDRKRKRNSVIKIKITMDK